jgi:hypothetical protein
VLKVYDGEKTASSTKTAGKTGSSLQKLKLDLCLSPYTRINSKWIKDLNIRPQSLKLVQERVGNTLELIGIGKDFLNGTPAAQQLRDNIEKWNFTKLKSSLNKRNGLQTEETTHRVGENIRQLYSKGLITRIYRELKNVNLSKINEPIKKWASELNRTFSKEDIQMAKKHMEKCSLSLAIKEMQTKTTLRFHLTTVRIAIIINTTNNRCCEDVGKKEPLYTAGGNVN